MQVLASDRMSGRQAGTDGEKAACEYIRGRFESIGLKTIMKDGGYVQAFQFPGPDNSGPVTAYNVIGFVNNNAERTAIIGAHYDHIGMGGKSSRSPGRHEVHNGADDNASGVAALLELATLAVHSKSQKNNYVFAAFSGHEQGLYGAEHFVKSNVCDMTKVVCMLNLDMVGRLDVSTRRLVVAGTSTSATLEETIAGLEFEGLDVVCRDLSRGDHAPFIAAKVPTLFFTTGIHDDYHKTSDDADKINYDGLALVVEYVRRVVETLDGKDTSPFRAAKGEPGEKQGNDGVNSSEDSTQR
ncbi:MAG: M28 family peptidase [Planctomycetota bacterium]|nr:M28 family peptidase [Planctomycetota bacterium]